jgi:L-2,4-diaminobutyric acid acetyltransferase
MEVDLIKFRKPSGLDGHGLHQLISRCAPLDTNSVYCNLLQCTDFADTAIAAQGPDGQLLGFISGYRPPGREDTLFVWQVAVDEAARGLGLGSRMLLALVRRLAPQGVRHIETTISPGNDASEALFRKVFGVLNAPWDRQLLFSREAHFAGQHDDEMLYRAGPFTLPIPSQA